MKSITAFLFFLSVVRLCVAQENIQGKILDSKTLEPLGFASVFINNTTIGTTADENGNFILKNIPEGDPELVFSYVGHESFQVYASKLNKQGRIEIKLRPLDLKEVEVTASRDDQWNKQLKKFENLFLGPGKSDTKILNPWVLEFSESDGNIFRAKASAPLEVQNLLLGYTLTYQLKDFVVSADAYNISGNTLFREIATNDPRQAKKWKQSREKAFQQSERNLLRAIIKNEIEKSGFQLYEDITGGNQIMRSGLFNQDVNKNLLPLKTEGRVFPGKSRGEFTIRLPERTEVHYLKGSSQVKYYRDVSHAVGWLEVHGGFLKVNSMGVVQNPGNMIVSGYLTEGRIAQLLPRDFRPDSISIATVAESRQRPTQSRGYEHVYLQVDKSYYYPGETIWFKGYMNYNDHLLKDSLSKIIYVDLITGGKVVAHKILPIEDADVIGDLFLPAASTIPGDYFIRAYTRWMENFDDATVTIKPIKVLELAETISPIQRLEESQRGMAITPDKERFHPHEKITLKFAMTDSSGAIQGNFSVSVTDVDRAAPVKEPTILELLPLRSVPSPTSLKYAPETAISIRGQLTDNKNNPAKGTVTITDEKLKGVFSVSTDDKGNFSLSNMHFDDSVRVAVNGKTANGKTGKVMMLPDTPKPVTEKLTPLELPVTRFAHGRSYNVFSFNDTSAIRLLPEVVVEGNKILQQKKSESFHGRADAVVTGDWLRSTHSTNLLVSLQSRVPGFYVGQYVDQSGLLKYRIRIGGGATSFMSESTPLVLINDTQLALPAEDLVNYLTSLSAYDIERVEILKFGGGAAYGTRGGNGVIAIYTRLGDDPLPVANDFGIKRFDKFTLTGYSRPKKFNHPNYEQETITGADYRTTIYWNPDIYTDAFGNAEVSFFAASNPGTYRIVAEGVTIAGEPVRGVVLINVGKD
jgi:hypothetical protein